MKGSPDIPDLGLGYLASAIRKAGYEVDILGWNNNLRQGEFKRYLKKNKPDIIGVKVFTHNVSAALKTLSTIKVFDPEIITIIGGPHPSANDPDETMKDFQNVDFAFRGDAEIGLSTLIKEIAETVYVNGRKVSDMKNLKDIPGLIWRNGNVTTANPPHFPEDLDSLGLPAWDLINPGNYNFYRIDESDRQGNVAPLIVTRGCPLSCTYCSVAYVNGKKIRRRSIASVIEEIGLLYDRYNVRQLTIMDTSFLSDKEYVVNLCKSVIERRLNVKWDCICDTLDNDFYTSEILNLMYRAGCRKIIMGVESGSDRILKVIQKKWNKKQFRDLVSLIKSHGIKTQGYFMYGFPGETAEDMRETRDFAFDAKFDRVFFNICYPLPGTAIYEYLRGKYEIERIDWKEFAVEMSPYPVSAVPSKEVMGFLYQTELLTLLNSVNIGRDFYKPSIAINFSKILIKYIFLFVFRTPRRVKQC
jgi:radical SAM superfamily enzyme YgiQ (UPF0313 family)